MANDGELKKSLTWLQGTALTVGGVIGSGILVLPAISAVIAGPASLLSWIIMGFLSLPMVIAVGEMSSSYPNSGGIAAYAEQAFSPRAGQLITFLILTAHLNYTGLESHGNTQISVIKSNFLSSFL